MMTSTCAALCLCSSLHYAQRSTSRWAERQFLFMRRQLCPSIHFLAVPISVSLPPPFFLSHCMASYIFHLLRPLLILIIFPSFLFRTCYLLSPRGASTPSPVWNVRARGAAQQQSFLSFLGHSPYRQINFWLCPSLFLFHLTSFRQREF